VNEVEGSVPDELPDDAELLGGTVIDWCMAKEF
jgi:hypothetical protein